MNPTPVLTTNTIAVSPWDLALVLALVLIGALTTFFAWLYRPRLHRFEAVAWLAPVRGKWLAWPLALATALALLGVCGYLVARI
jgi:hypothetical protein